MATLGAACRPSVAPEAPRLVVQAVLVLDSTDQQVFVQAVIPPGVPAPDAPLPVDTSALSLRIDGADGASCVGRASPASSVRYTCAITPGAGVAYTLAGSYEGRAFALQTVAPHRVAGLSVGPVGDSLRVSWRSDVEGPFAVHYLLDGETPDQVPFALTRQLTADTSVMIGNPWLRGAPPEADLRILVATIDPALDAWLRGATTYSEERPGLFGAMALAVLQVPATGLTTRP